MCHPSSTTAAGPSRPTSIAMPTTKFHPAPVAFETLETPALSPSSVEGDSYFAFTLGSRPSSSGSSGLRTPMATLVASTPIAHPKAQNSEGYTSAESKVKEIEAQLEELGLELEDVPEDIMELLLAAAELQDGGEALRLHLQNLGEVL
ncbi:hypothetical protein A1Q2_00515 [Trichosporon asahii var. asahii CBS 8904]|uniref:Uncharacterized protein n=1 Tax=Trichosporon asahii var. asahii (strain CBS 8904) TaxID=1220162 RepID=K1VMA6_TRIAC|nr:hypothetical protein A1Q2_00515 [Trichosporon asahii var. asahii CBS 8904]